MEIRKAFRERDIDGMVELLNQLFEVESDFSPNELHARKGLKLLLESELSCVLIACEGVKIIGMCTAQILISTAAGGLKAQIEDVVVDAAYRRKGVGGRLIREMMKIMKEKGVIRLVLAMDKNNLCASYFYQKQGWSELNMKLLYKEL